MDIKEKIEKAIKTAQDNLIADRVVLEEAVKKFRNREREEEEPVKLLIQEYLDNELKDAYGNPVLEGYVISSPNGYPAYKVVERGMQFVLGIPMFNPSVKVVTYKRLAPEEPILGKKVKTIGKRELANMITILDLRNNL